MHISKLCVAIVGGLLIFSEMAQAQNSQTGVVKTIRITANISDSIFVSRPEGGEWYDTVGLVATDGRQRSFTANIPIQVWTTTQGVNVSLVHPLDITRTDAVYKMEKVGVRFGDAGSAGKELGVGHATQTFTQKLKVGNGYQSVYQVQIKADAPAARNDVSTQGYYTGDLVMLFEIPPSAI
ncbi:hypothetical protein Z042_10655 [Chania multitudinisentens RB-25]|uniref:Fimbrial assembly protein n=1 Tax=Chania multitudinisentens RB-25 TaxID=1441930 RepID=W0LFV8_9GAMM|nr:CS1 type fimbrial major subunit [Chania multitudinisentens]AHG22748.1 hypothetical protein Z042_10655 [Chania multitudinisentens RB-25]